MNRREYIAARRTLRKEFFEIIAATKNALQQRFKKLARRAKFNRQDPNWEVRIRKNVYRQIRESLGGELYTKACRSPEVKNPSGFVERLLAKIDVHDEESKVFPMTARDWLRS